MAKLLAKSTFCIVHFENSLIISLGVVKIGPSLTLHFFQTHDLLNDTIWLAHRIFTPCFPPNVLTMQIKSLHWMKKRNTVWSLFPINWKSVKHAHSWKCRGMCAFQQAVPRTSNDAKTCRHSTLWHTTAQLQKDARS